MKNDIAERFKKMPKGEKDKIMVALYRRLKGEVYKMTDKRQQEFKLIETELKNRKLI